MAIDWTHLYTKYAGKWVALEDDNQTVIAAGGTAKEAYDNAVGQGANRPILHRVPNRIIPFIGELH